MAVHSNVTKQKLPLTFERGSGACGVNINKTKENRFRYRGRLYENVKF